MLYDCMKNLKLDYNDLIDIITSLHKSGIITRTNCEHIINELDKIYDDNEYYAFLSGTNVKYACITAIDRAFLKSGYDFVDRDNIIDQTIEQMEEEKII